jgi:hypothetical protein
MTLHVRALTYEDKIGAVKDGRCKQTIRKLNPERPTVPGDILLLHTWEARPYRSKWSWRGYYRVLDVMVINLFVRPNEHEVICDDGSREPLTREDLTELARKDFIAPVDGRDREVDGGDLLLTLVQLNGGALENSLWEVIRWASLA